MSGSVLVVVPTYNERLTIEPMTARLRQAVPEAHVLVVDDNSPDGTGALAESLSRTDDHIAVLHRPAKEGLGPAYVAGLTWGAAHGFDVLVQMDSDGSHRPEDLPHLLDALQEADLVIGSRWVPAGQVRNWPISRRLLSRAGSEYARVVLRLPVKDSTGGYRALRSDALGRLHLERIASRGYAFQVETTWRAVRAGLRVVEVPITFIDREQGSSKMSAGIVAEALLRVTLWGLEHRLTRMAGPREAMSRERPGASRPGSVTGRFYREGADA